LIDSDLEVVWHGAMWRGPQGIVMGQHYQFKKKGVGGDICRPRGGPDPQVVGERLEHIRRRRGRLTPQLVVEDAKPIASPIHEYFEWNDAKAGEQWRLSQARHLIASVYIVEPSTVLQEPVVTRAFVAVDSHADARYEPIAAVLSDAEMYAQVCRRAHAELIGFQDRYADFFALKQIGQKAAAEVEQELRNAEPSVEQIA